MCPAGAWPLGVVTGTSPGPSTESDLGVGEAVGRTGSTLAPQSDTPDSALTPAQTSTVALTFAYPSEMGVP